ncbi:hypothetical protein [Leptolyngbya sp. FACHB-261]|uniref:hypothetical protein n=1 Tax=Leptolyngbya sp. FACHB-261 TaxID=2692806 RepID=UPI001686C7EE|nr:hypothetical protein [Leptolyngbya sp. FACHB-261]MBD2102475.1 hypothetical protein [Leptolyngbya sp. FACHB-261]
MNKPLNETLSRELGDSVASKPKTPFENAYRAALATKGAMYVQGFLVIVGKSEEPIEHAWIELDEQTVDPTLPHLNRDSQKLCYFTAQRLSIKQLKAAVEEAKEDYPEDNPLPIYGAAPYEYYGDVMLGGMDYLEAYEAARTKCRESLERP